MTNALSRCSAVALCLVLFTSGAGADCLAPAWEPRSFDATDGSLRNTLAVADFNTDGILDVAVLGRTSGALLLTGTGNGFFGPPVSVFARTGLRDLIAKDLNGDTKTDLLIIEDGFERLAFLPGNGDGTFGTEILSSAPMGTTFVLDDFTDDGIDDVAAFFIDGSEASIILFAGNGVGAFAEIRRVPLASTPSAIAAGDLDADGASDLVVSYTTLPTLDLFFGNDDGTFDPAVSKQSGMGAREVTLADAEGDGDLDILAPHFNDSTVAVHRNRGGRLFDAATIYPVTSLLWQTSGPSDVAVADVTGDGVADLLVSAANGDYIATLRGEGDATFGDASFRPFLGFNSPAGRIGAITDLDDDARLDVIATESITGSVVVLHNHCGDVTVGLEASTPTISVGQSATVRVTAEGFYPAQVIATGIVSIFEGETTFATGTLSNGEAVLTIPGLALGDHTLVARYAGDDQYEPAQSATIVQHVTSNTTTTIVTTEPSESDFGQGVFVRAVVTSSAGTTPTGMIDLGIGSFSWQGQASPAGDWTSDLDVGSHTAFARYAGDATHPPSEAATITHVVRKGNPTVKFSTIQLKNPSGSDVDVWIAIDPEFSGIPTGTVRLYDRTVPVGTNQISVVYSPIFSLNGLTAGRHDFRATYEGDANFNQAESALVTHQAFPTTGLHIDARGSTTGINLIWPVPGQSSYLMKAVAPTQDFAGGSTYYSGSPPFFDQQTSAGVVYLYRIEWRGSENQVLAVSPIDLGVRMTFSEDPLLPGMKVRASHFQEVIDATNFLRGKVGQSLVTFNDLAAGTSIRASHITTLRTKINEARIALGAAPVSFIRAIAPGDIIRAQDLQELREAVH